MARVHRVRPDMVLDLTPIMSLIVHLLPMLLILVRFRQIAEIDVTGPVLPTVEAPDAATYAAQADRVVSVSINAEGFVVGGLGDLDPRVACRGRCTPETYDLPGLVTLLREARRRHPTEDRVVVAPMPGTPYQVVVDVMDAARSVVVDGKESPLFPTVLLAAPTEGR